MKTERRKVLVVEDDNEYRGTLVQEIRGVDATVNEDFTLEVLEASTRDEALAVLEREKKQILFVITDGNLEGDDGETPGGFTVATQAVRSSIPYVFIHSKMSIQFINESRRDGEVPEEAKIFVKDEIFKLLDRIEEILELQKDN